MTSQVTGGCLCGAVRYESIGPVGPAGYCHCTDCRRCTGSAFNVSIRAEVSKFRIVAGRPTGFTKKADSGTELTRHFCLECGSPIYTSSPRHPEWVWIKAGSLDDPTLVLPAYQSWTRSRVPWAFIDPGIPEREKGGAWKSQPRA
jgi:hypothetical protein